MAGRQVHEAEFRLIAQLGSGFSNTFKSAQKELSAVQKEFQSLSRVQSDISAYQKQQAAVTATTSKLENLQQQHALLQKEIGETTESTSGLEREKLKLEQRIQDTNIALERQNQRLENTSQRLQDAKVDTADLESESAKLGSRMNELREEQSKAAEGAENFGNKAGQAFSAIHDAIVAAGIATALKGIYEYFADCAQASMDFESAMTGVAKTTDLTDNELAAMSNAIKEMSTEIPATTEELAAIAESAGQLGIHKESLLDFTEIMAMLGTSTNMTADEAATSLSRLANITGMSQDDFDKLGSTIVDLGNNLATTEQEIVDMSLRIAGAGSQVGMTEAEIMAFSGALSSVGIEADAGGSAFSTLISNMSLAVQQGGDDLEQFADVAGMSADEFAAAFEQDAAGAIIQFIQGLGQMDSQGRSAIAVLDEMGLSDIRMRDAFLRAAGASDTFTNALQVGSNAWKNNTALTAEASKRYTTTKSQLQMMQNAYTRVTVAIGDAYIPVLQEVYSIGTDVLNGVAQFVERNPALVNAVTAFLGVLGAVTIALTAYTAVIKIAQAATAAFATVSGVALGPIFAVTAAVAAVVAAVAAFATTANDAVPSVKELTEAAREMEETMDEAKATYNDTVASTMATASVADTYIDKLEALEAAGLETNEAQSEYQNTLALLLQVMPSLSDCISQTTDQYGRTTYTLETTTDALRANTEAWRENAMQQAYLDQMTAMYASYADVLIEAEKNSIGLETAQGDLDVANEKREYALARMNELWDEAAEKSRAYNKGFNGITDASTFLPQEYKDMVAVLNEADDEIRVAERSMKNYKSAIEDDNDAVAAAEAEIKLWEMAIEDVIEATYGGTYAIEAMLDPIRELGNAYTEAYNAALSSIEGQYAIWDEADDIVETSAASINAALESQIEYWQTYNANLASLGDRAEDIEGLSEMLADFADGSVEHANAIAGMAAAEDEDLRKMVDNWKTLQQEHQDAATNLAEVKTGMTELTDDMVREFNDAIQDMELSAEARESAASTIQAFIDAADEMLPQVQTAYARVGYAALSALGSRSSYKTPSGRTEITPYATGTTNAADIFLAGEEGPELVIGQRGASVFPVQETQRIIEALPGGGNGGGTQITFAPVYHLQGVSNAADLEAVLRGHDEEMREYIRQVVADADADAARRRYG